MQRLVSFLLCGLFFLASNVHAQEARQKNVSVTIYNNNLGVVKDVREINLKNKRATVRLTAVASLIDPTSVHASFKGRVVEQNFQYDLVSMSKILEKYIDRPISLIHNDDALIEGKLLSFQGNQLVLEKLDGGLQLIPNVDEYKLTVGALPEGLITKPTLIWLVQADRTGRQDVEVTYQTQGLSWHAEYIGVLNKSDTKMDLKSWVNITNSSGAAYTNAELKLVAGDVHRAMPQPYRTPRPMMSVAAEQMQEKQFEEQSFFEYHLYDLERRTTLSQNETKQISLFEAKSIPVKKIYYYASNRLNHESNVAVQLKFKNEKRYGLGIPLPKGKFRFYKPLGTSTEFLGEDWLKHTAKNQEVKQQIGNAFEILGETVQTKHQRISKNVHEYTYKISLTNRKEEAIAVEVERHLGRNWKILRSSHKFTQKDASTVHFKVPVKKDSKAEVLFTVRYSY